MLLQGADELDVTLGREADIARCQAHARAQRPWEWPN